MTTIVAITIIHIVIVNKEQGAEYLSNPFNVKIRCLEKTITDRNDILVGK
jgi:hypothetical protein